MCQETLISYLVKETGLKEQDIRDFILLGDFLKDEDTSKDKRQGIHDMMISEDIYKIDQDGNIVVNRLQDIDDALASIRVADPAVGSGAFPLGMLNEIVRARENISAYMAIPMNGEQRKFMYSNTRSPYSLKRTTIQNCIFAADIEPSAVDIARLRLWLSLVIDDEIDPNASPLYGHRDPIPLPNLECNIICGNSLIDEFEGHRLIPQSKVLGTERGEEYSWHQQELEALIPRLIDAQNRLFNCDDIYKKEQIKEEVPAIKDQMIRTELSGLTQDSLERYEEGKKLASKPYVLWQIDFARVFREKGGFDVVIGNPPYIQLQKSINDVTGEKLGDSLEGLGFETFSKTGDIYCLFYEKGFRLLHAGGFLAFITSNKWLKAGYGKKLRSFLAKNVNPIKLIDFGSQKVFASATVDVNILLFRKEHNKGTTQACTISDDCTSNLSVYVEHKSSSNSFTTDNSWTILSSIERTIRSKIEDVGLPLSQWNLHIYRGILTGYNDAFIISTEKKDELIAADPKSAEIIRPILRGRDIKRYSYSFAGLWLIVTHNGIKAQNIPPININDYPAIKRHLDNYYPKLAKRADKGDTPYNLRNCVYMNDFFKQKIVYREISDAMNACIVEPGIMLNNKCYLVTGKHLIYIISYLNSKLFTKIVLPKANVTGGKGEGFLNEIKLIEPSPETESMFINLYKQRENGADVDIKVDNLFCSLYGLTSDEIRYVLE